MYMLFDILASGSVNIPMRLDHGLNGRWPVAHYVIIDMVRIPLVLVSRPGHHL